jgi:prepilin-type N-terminal cleavage/methylation domain-containing protein
MRHSAGYFYAPHYHCNMKRDGFSLVELSIVLVILGLLVGGIMGGKSLIRAAEMRAVSSEYQRYITAVNAFRDKYLSIPGDMSNAANFWGIAANCPGTETQGSTTTATCNGNYDRILAPSATSNEPFRFWQQLANAGLLEGTYSGVRASTNDWATTRTNAPSSKVSNAVWFTWNNIVAWSGSTAWFDYDTGNRLDIGGLSTNAQPGTPIFRPEEVWNIDTKIDDGKPGRGKLMVVYWDDCTDATSSAQTSANYLLTNDAVACFITFPNAF